MLGSKLVFTSMVILCFVGSVDSQCPREIAVNDYNNLYLASDFSSADIQWTGSVSNCDPGTISQTVLDKLVQRINYYRKLVGGLTTTISFTETHNLKCQAAALMFDANDALDHNPPNTWLCWTQEGYDGANMSNIGYGSFSNPIDNFMEDNGSNNNLVGHRRWILYSRQARMGAGLTPEASALWTFGEGAHDQTFTYDQFVAYPPKGYVPRSLVYDRWSFGIPDESGVSTPPLSFFNATVTMTGPDGNVPLTIIGQGGGFGDPTIIWEPQGIITDSDVDVKYTVTVSGISNAPQSSYTYDVWIINPVHPPTCPIGEEWDQNSCSCVPVQTCLVGDVTPSLRCIDGNHYDLDLTVTYFNPPAGEQLIVNNQSFPVTGSPQVITLNNLPADGNPVNVTVKFSTSQSCMLTKNNLFVAPASGQCTASCPFYLASDLPKDITDGGTTTSRVQVDATGSITDVNVLNLKGQAAFAGLMTFQLTSPAGTTIDLISPTQVYFPSPFNVSLDDEAANVLPSLYTDGGTYQPSGNLSAFDGESPTGKWTLSIKYPVSSSDIELLNGWSLEVCTTGGSQVCMITGLQAGSQTNCDEQNNTYTREVLVYYKNAPAGESLIVNGQNKGVPTSSPATVVLTGTADGNPVSVSAYFTNNQSCTRTENNLFVAPNGCSVCSISNLTAGTTSACNPATNMFTQDIVVTYSNPPGMGSLVVNGVSSAIMSSPQTVQLTLPANGMPVDVEAHFSADQGCSKQIMGLFTAPQSCNTCMPAYNNPCTSDDYIQDFSFGSYTNLGTGCGNPGSDNISSYLGMGPTVTPGQEYDVIVRAGAAYDQYIGLYIDFNQDGDYSDSGEFFDMGQATAGNTVTQKVTIPSGALTGTSELRVRSSYYGPLTVGDACSTLDYGETEEYNIYVMSASGCVTTAALFLNNTILPQTYYGNEITSSGNLSGGGVHFRASSGIKLEPTFEVGINSVFTAEIDPCVCVLSQWAISATASSYYAQDPAPNFYPEQATGAPDVNTCGDNPKAWAPETPLDIPEFLRLSYQIPVKASGVRIYETANQFNPGFVYKVEFVDTNGMVYNVWEGNDTTPCGGVFVLDVEPTSYLVKEVIVHTQLEGWEEIDAVELVGAVCPN